MNIQGPSPLQQQQHDQYAEHMQLHNDIGANQPIGSIAPQGSHQSQYTTANSGSGMSRGARVDQTTGNVATSIVPIQSQYPPVNLGSAISSGINLTSYDDQVLGASNYKTENDMLYYSVSDDYDFQIKIKSIFH